MPRGLTGYAWNSETRDPAEVLVGSLHDCLAKGVKLTFIAQQAGLARQTVSGINSGRTKRVTLRTQGMLLATIMDIESGVISVPDNARRPLGLAPVLAQGKHGERCGYGHERTEANTRIVNGKRICKRCETRRRKQYELRKVRAA